MTRATWQREIPRNASAFEKNMFLITRWTSAGEMRTEEVYGARLDALIIWDTNELPRSQEIVDLLRTTGLRVALYGTGAPKGRRNPELQLLTFMATKSSVPIAALLRTVWFWSSRSGRIFVKDMTIYKRGEFSKLMATTSPQ